MTNVYFISQAYHSKTNGWTKGLVIKSDPAVDNEAAALQTYHAYLGAYAYEHDANTDLVSVFISDTNGTILMTETWEKAVEPEPEPNAE